MKMYILNSAGHTRECCSLATVNMGAAKNMDNQRARTERRRCEGVAAAIGHTAALGPWCQLMWTVIRMHGHQWSLISGLIQ